MLINLLLDYNFQSKLYESHYTIKSTFETKISLKQCIHLGLLAIGLGISFPASPEKNALNAGSKEGVPN